MGSSPPRVLLPTDIIGWMPGVVSLPWGYFKKPCYVLRQCDVGHLCRPIVGRLDPMLALSFSNSVASITSVTSLVK